MQEENSTEEKLAKENHREEDRLDNLLSRYVSVWLWSILFAGTTGFTYYWSFFLPSRNLLQTSMMLILGASVTVCLTATWLHLFLYLKDVIIPDVIHRSKDMTDSVDRRLAGKRLEKAYLYMITAGILGLITRSVMHLFSPLP